MVMKKLIFNPKIPDYKENRCVKIAVKSLIYRELRMDDQSIMNSNITDAKSRLLEAKVTASKEVVEIKIKTFNPKRPNDKEDSGMEATESRPIDAYLGTLFTRLGNQMHGRRQT